MSFHLKSSYHPKGDQPKAIASLVANVQESQKAQTLLGVTGSGKTFTMANVIAQLNRPTLVISHNKTLAAQLYAEFKEFFPDNAVEYFVSYYDYYQPEAYIPSRNVYIEKELSINEEIERLRLRTSSSLLSGRRDVIVVASVSCIYGMGSPVNLKKQILSYRIGDIISRHAFLLQLVSLLYNRNDNHLKRGTFRVRGDMVDLYLASEDYAYRFLFFGDELEAIHKINPITGTKLNDETAVNIFPANLFATGQEVLERSIGSIEQELNKQIRFFLRQGYKEEAERLEARTRLDIGMMREVGYCHGIENYSRFFDGRVQGERPFCLIDYFPKDFLTFIDESHVSIPQIKGMWGGDHARKKNLVNYGFRIPSAMDNRPLNLKEFEGLLGQVVYVSATPSEYELIDSEGVIVEQLIRPTGLLDPKIEVHRTQGQIDHLIGEINRCVQRQERVLVTTLTKKMAEKLTEYMGKLSIKCRYIHSEVKTLDRVVILEDLRSGVFDVLIGVNLLREGLDLPEVALVAILDADKEGFLRNARSLIQTIGRAARHVNGKVIMYADQRTPSMKQAIQETERRRKMQEAHNKKHRITPHAVQKAKSSLVKKKESKPYVVDEALLDEVAESTAVYMSLPALKKAIKQLEKKVDKASQAMDYIRAGTLQRELQVLKAKLAEKLALSP